MPWTTIQKCFVAYEKFVEWQNAFIISWLDRLVMSGSYAMMLADCTLCAIYKLLIFNIASHYLLINCLSDGITNVSLLFIR